MVDKDSQNSLASRADKRQRLSHKITQLVNDLPLFPTDARVLGTLWDRMVSVVHQENAELGMDHCEIGARICRKWNFSPLIQEAVRRHHSPILNGDFSFAGAIIFLSHFISASDPSGDILSTLLATKVLARLDLTTVDFEKARSQYKSRTQNSNGKPKTDQSMN